MMAFKTLAVAGAALATAALVGAGSASAQEPIYRPLTVAPHRAPMQGYYVPQQPAYNPYGGPGVIVTGPVHIAGTLATAPFRAINSVFPPQGNTPLVLIGAPVYLAGKLVELPFRIAEAPFGGPDPFRY